MSDGPLSGRNDPQSPPATPRWVKVFAVIAVVVVLLFLVLLVTGADHGPGRHLGLGGGAPPVTNEGPSHR